MFDPEPISSIYLIGLFISSIIISAIIALILAYLDEHKWDKEVLRK
jgi:capsular polysaccharide biosynthesis protein